MIPSTRLLLFAAVAAVFAPSLFAKDSSRRSDVPELQLVINVSAQPDPTVAEDAAENFALVLDQAFRRDGYVGEINHIYRERVKPGHPVLAIQLVRWWVDRLGSPECTFTADLKTGDSLIRLGEFTATDLGWDNGAGPRDKSAATRKVAERALRKLTKTLREQGALEGFPSAPARK